MESLKWKFLSLVPVASMSFLISCGDDDNNGGNDNGEVETLKGTVASDVTLKVGTTCKLSGEHIIETDAILNIEAGVKIISVYGDIVDYILIRQGTKVNTMGTVNAPIVMTGEKEGPGAWGGIHICGKACTNAEGDKGSPEVGGAICGGNDGANSSDKLRYMHVEYTGYTFGEEHEANGVTFCGVGNGIIVDHYQAYKGSDSDLEFFSGSVDVSNVVVMSCSGDSFDWTERRDGKGTDLIAYQEPKATLSYDCNCLIGADNNEDDNAANSISHPTLKNLVLAGGDENEQGIRLRCGTRVHIDNAKVCGRGQPLAVGSALTNSALRNGTSLLADMTISAELATDGDYTNADFITATDNKMDATLSYASFDAIKAECDWMNGNWVK